MRAPIGSKRFLVAHAGFSLLEVLVAITILLFGVVAVAQAVPWVIDLDLRNRNSTSLVIAERELEQMVRQPLDVQTNALQDYNFSDADGNDRGTMRLVNKRRATLNTGGRSAPITLTFEERVPLCQYSAHTDRTDRTGSASLSF